MTERQDSHPPRRAYEYDEVVRTLASFCAVAGLRASFAPCETGEAIIVNGRVVILSDNDLVLTMGKVVPQ